MSAMYLKEAVEVIAKSLASFPQSVEVEAVEDEPQTWSISLRVHPDDRGRIIGRRGKTINAIRTLVRAAATKTQQRVNIEVCD